MFNSKPLTVKTSKTARRYELPPSSATAVLPKCHAASPRTAPKNPRGGRGEKGWNLGPTQRKKIPDLDMAIFNVVVGDLELHQFQNLTFRPQNDTRFEAGSIHFPNHPSRLVYQISGGIWALESYGPKGPIGWFSSKADCAGFTLKVNVRIGHLNNIMQNVFGSISDLFFRWFFLHVDL